MNSTAATTMSTNGLLPYFYDDHRALNEESRNWIETVKEGLVKTISIGDLHRGTNFYVKSLGQLTKLGHCSALTIGEVCFISNLLFDLVCTQELDPSLRAKWATTLAHFIKKNKKILQQSEQEQQISFEWRKLYELVVHMHLPAVGGMEGKASIPTQMGRGFALYHLQSLLRLVKASRRYFSNPQQTTDAILQSVSPYICPHTPQIIRAQLLMVHFLPTHSLVAVEGWIDSILSLWDDGWLDGFSEWDTNWLDLFARLSRDLCGALRWDANNRFKRVFSIVSRIVHNEIQDPRLPAPLLRTYPECFFPFSKGLHEKFALVGKLLAFIFPSSSQRNISVADGYSSEYLEELMTSISSYFHPSNNGTWTSSFSLLLKALSTSFANRIRRESKNNLIGGLRFCVIAIDICFTHVLFTRAGLNQQ